MNSDDPVDHASNEEFTYLQTMCPKFRIQEILQRTAKSILIAGKFGDKLAVAKLLTDNGPFWRDRFLHELNFYATIQEIQAPVLIPKLLHADRKNLIMIQEYLAGEPLADHRYPTQPINGQGFRLLAKDLPSLHTWTPWPEPNRGGVIRDYESRLAKHLGRGLITSADIDAASALLSSIRWAPEFNHGDLLLTNCLFDASSRTIAFLDWEYAGYFVPGYDIACLKMLVLDEAEEHSIIVNEVDQLGENRGMLFHINMMIVLARELHILLEVRHIESFRGRFERAARELKSTRVHLKSIGGW